MQLGLQTPYAYCFYLMSSGAGVLATSSGLLFVSTSEGNLIALDENSGKSLWHYQTGGGIDSSPISYSVDGKQFVAVSVGNVLYSFALPD
jgi:outer membrane protein assembly factor BamB